MVQTQLVNAGPQASGSAPLGGGWAATLKAVGTAWVCSWQHTLVPHRGRRGSWKRDAGKWGWGTHLFLSLWKKVEEEDEVFYFEAL